MDKIIQACKTKKAKLIFAIIMIPLVAGAVFFGSTYYTKNEINAIQQAKNVDAIKTGKVVDTTSTLSIKEITEGMHKMANSLIVAKDIWGKTEMNRKNVNEMYVALHSQSDSDQKKILMEIITKWDKADFSGIDTDHNRLWLLLNGSVGVATGANIKSVEAAVKNMK